MVVHISRITSRGNKPLCEQPMLDGDSLIGDTLGDDLADATCPSCRGKQAKFEAEWAKWPD